jgi:hypothetical protein
MEEDNKKLAFEMALAVAITVLLWTLIFRMVA